MDIFVLFIISSYCLFKKKVKEESPSCISCNDEFIYVDNKNLEPENNQNREIAEINEHISRQENNIRSSPDYHMISSSSESDSYIFEDLIDLNFSHKDKITNEFFQNKLEFFEYLKNSYENETFDIKNGSKNFFENLKKSLNYSKSLLSEECIGKLKKMKLSKDVQKEEINKLHKFLTVTCKYKEDIGTRIALMNFLFRYPYEIIYMSYYYPEFYASILVCFANIEIMPFYNVCKIFSMYLSFFRSIHSEENRELGFKCLINDDELKEKSIQLIDNLYCVIYYYDLYPTVRRSLRKFITNNKLSLLSPTLISLRMMSFFISPKSIHPFNNFLEDIIVRKVNQREAYVTVKSKGSFKFLYGSQIILCDPSIDAFMTTCFEGCLRNNNLKKYMIDIDTYIKSNNFTVLEPFLNLHLYGMRILLPFFHFVDRKLFTDPSSPQN